VSIRDDYDGPPSEGTIEVKLSVDDVDDVYIFGSKVFRKTQRGQPSEAGTAELTGPLPRHGSIRLDDPPDAKRDGRGDWDYLELPGDNGNRILFTVFDPRGGDDRYEFRFRWRIEE
jgi:hypothetical protein